MKQLNKLNLREIRENSVIFDDGSLIAVFKLVLPDFSKMPKNKKQLAVANYRLWLHFLDYPVQICCRTVNSLTDAQIDIINAKTEEHMKTKKDSSEALMDYHRFYHWLKENAKTDFQRVYYLVIPYLPHYTKKKHLKKLKDIEKYLQQLNNRCALSIKLLERTGIKCQRLNNQSLAQMYSSYFTFSYHDREYMTMQDCLARWREEE